jgi:hypothetical protein
MVRRLLLLILLSGSAFAQGTLAGANGDCAVGGQQALTQGLPSTGTQQINTTNVLSGAGVLASFPNCTVTVYTTGTANKPSIYSNNPLSSPTVLSNPFTANTDGSWTFFVSPGSCVDITISNGTGPTLPYPRTYTDVCLGANGSGGGGGNPTLDNCTPDETGNSFYSVISLSNYFYAHWEFVAGQSSYINCTVYIPTAQTGATLVLDIAANDTSSGHTANFQTCDAVINSGTINTGSLSCASAQTFTTTTLAYNRVSLTFNVQSTLSNGSILVVKIATSTTGTQPAANMVVYPHFVL